MSSLAQDYIDLIASRDKQKIGCVLLAAGAAAGASGLAAGVYFAPANALPGAGQAINATAAGVGAVLGALLSASAAYNMCGGEETRGSFDGIFKTGSNDPKADYKGHLVREFGVSESEANLLTKAAVVYLNMGGATNTPATRNEQKNAVAQLLKKLSDEGVSTA